MAAIGMEAGDITAAEFDQLRRLIREVTGISLPESKKALLVGRLGRRLRHFGMGTFSEYYRMVRAGPPDRELQTMVDLVTTNETYFFREEKHFDFLRNAVLGTHARGRSFDVWSAASSTGEEIYTLAMVIADVLGTEAPWSVLGTDVSLSVLEVAQRGLYRLERVRGLPRDYLRKYWLKGIDENDGTILVAPELARHTRFMQVNLNAALPELGKFQVIFLRNVMIYFDSEIKQQVVARIVRQLLPGGYLIVGHSESLTGIAHPLVAVQPTIYRLPG